MAKTTKKGATKASGSDTTSDEKKKATKKKTTKKKASAKKAVSKKKAVAKKSTAKKATSKKAAKVYGAISSAERHQMISEAAYLRSEAQGFAGDGRQDWLDAEADVDARLVKAKIKIVD